MFQLRASTNCRPVYNLLCLFFTPNSICVAPSSLPHGRSLPLSFVPPSCHRHLQDCAHSDRSHHGAQRPPGLGRAVSTSVTRLDPRILQHPGGGAALIKHPHPRQQAASRLEEQRHVDHSHAVERSQPRPELHRVARAHTPCHRLPRLVPNRFIH